jgi:outer membrane protein assembly factor BamA
MRLTLGLRGAALSFLALLPWASPAWAVGEVVADVKVQSDARTEPETVRSIAGVEIGEVIESDTLDKARERLHTAGLFSSVDVYHEPFKHGVRVVIVVRDKFPWAPVPTLSFSPGNNSAGLVIGHTNLFGRGKRGVIGGRYSNVDSGALAAYDDPALFGSWLFWTLKGRFQDQVMPEYANRNDLEGLPVSPIRETKMRSFAGDVRLGVAWFRKVKTAIGWFYDTTEVRGSTINADNPFAPPDLPDSAASGKRGLAFGIVTFDFRAREHAVMYGAALSFTLDYASPRFGSDDHIEYWKAIAEYEMGFRLFRKHNLVLRAASYVGENIPFWSENATSGANLRGFVYRQFIGDTLLRTQVEYHFPLFSIKQLDVRGLVFNDAAATWFRTLPPETPDGKYETRSDGRSFLPPGLLVPGFDAQRDVHTSVGAGLRFYLRTVSAPLVGFDLGHGIGTGTLRFVLVIGA